MIWRFYYYAGSARIAMRVKDDNINLVFYLFTDHLGSTNAVTDPVGGMVSLSLYMPWGESRGGAGTSLTDYAFTGQHKMDDSVGLIYYGARFYDPALGRWAQPDTIVPQASQGVQAWDRFAYTNNNPVLYTDKTGHDVGCGREDDSECAQPVVVVIACGQNETCDTDSKMMKPYSDFAKEKKDYLYWYNNDKSATAKLDMANAISDKIKANPNLSFILAGHSAGADALILANSKAGYAENIKGTVLIAPHMDYTDKNGGQPSLQNEADNIPAGKVALIAGLDEILGRKVPEIKGTDTQLFLLTNHEGLATSQRVFNWVKANFDWFR